MPPFLTKSEFHPDGVYRINVDNNGDAQADVAFTFVFSELKDGTQTGTAYYATGSQARQPEPAGDVLLSATPVGFDATARPVQAGPCRLFAGVRSDPFFADADGAFHGFKWTGNDAFANRNILSLALEVPNEMLGADPVIGVWATVSVRRDGVLVPVDRGGHPTINPFINPNDVKDQFNVRQPADDVANYLQPWSKVLEDNGYTPDEAVAAARIVLPDILRYDRYRPAAYPNGRAVTDDAFSARFAWLTNGKVGAQGFEALGAAILVVGVVWSFVLAAAAARRSGWSGRTYQVLRQAFSGTLLLGLEVLAAADLLRTVAVAPTLDNVYVLGLIVAIRTFLSFSLETEIDGVAPWRRTLAGGDVGVQGFLVDLADLGGGQFGDDDEPFGPDVHLRRGAATGRGAPAASGSAGPGLLNIALAHRPYFTPGADAADARYDARQELRGTATVPGGRCQLRP
jgi:uncharacterized membrane protein